jgi:hemerythrin
MADEKSSIEWTPDLSVGIEVIDEDHKTFFVVADLMECAIRDTPEGMEVILKSALMILLEYVDGHFLREERAMEAAGYPGYEEHRALHDAFKATVNQFVDDYDKIINPEQKRATTLTLAKNVYKWVVYHIVNVDQAYKGYVMNEHVDSRPLAFLSQEASGDFGEDDDFDLMNMIPKEDQP